jgi:hypothetical protein
MRSGPGREGDVWWIDWLNTFIVHIPILSNAHGAWLMFWPVLWRCHIQRWDWSVLPLGASFHFPFWELRCMLVSVCFHNLVTFSQRLQDLYSACLMFWMRTHTGPQYIPSNLSIVTTQDHGRAWSLWAGGLYIQVNYIGKTQGGRQEQVVASNRYIQVIAKAGLTVPHPML